jgi:TRAP transporter TAXI family solute receptor
MKRNKLAMAFSGALGCLALLALPMMAAWAKPIQWPKAMAIGGAKEGTSYYSEAVAMGRIMTKYLPTTVTGQVTGGSYDNILRIQDGTREMGIVSAMDLYNANRGLKEYEKVGKVPVRIISMGPPGAYRIVTRADLGIKTIPDLKGKIIEVANPGSVLGWDAMERIFKAYGMDLYKDSKARPRGSVRSSVQHLKEGKCDAFCSAGSAGNIRWGIALEASTLFPVYYIPVDKDKIEKINNEAPYWSYGEFPVGVDKQVNTEPVPCLWYRKALSCLPNLNDEIVFAITKSLMEHAKEAGELYAGAGEYNMDRFADGLSAPFHSGAIKYYKEKGIWTPKMEALHKRLLKETGATE